MIDEAVLRYIEERKSEWLKKKIKASMSEEEKEMVEQEVEKRFDIGEWLRSAARRAGQMSLSTHPCTFSHPSARKNKNGHVTPIIANSKHVNDGLLRSGNVDVENDALGNAAVIDVYKFLTIALCDGKKVFEHLIEETPQAKELLASMGEEFEEVREGLLAMLRQNSQQMITSSKIKQVYFPIGENSYHLLSVLTPSGIVFALKEKIDEIKFGKKSKDLREKKRQDAWSDEDFMEIPNVTMIKYGGTKPQNISILNNRYGGRAYLLRSMPPALKKRSVKFPKRDFFKESLSLRSFAELFDAIVKLVQTDYNNVHMRESRKNRYRQIVEKIVERMWEVRSVVQEQYIKERSKLPNYQKVWLLHTASLLEQPEDDSWLEELQREIVRWIIGRLEFKLGKDFLLGPEERKDIEYIVSEYEEVLR